MTGGRLRANVKLFFVDFCDEVFPKNWINCSVPVVFDFLGLEDEEKADVFQKYLYLLLPKQKSNDSSAFMLYLPRTMFIPLINNEWELFYPKLVSSIIDIQKAKRKSTPQPIIYFPKHRFRRRF